MKTATGTRGARAAATIARLLDSVAAILRTEGAGALSVQRVAEAAGTSKALVHYHFSGKDALLVACVERLAGQLEHAEGDALSGSAPETALADLWDAMMQPRTRGLRRALLALTTGATPATEVALVLAAVRRRQAATRVLLRLEELLGFAPAIPRGTLSVAFIALIDGLTLSHPLGSGQDQRQAFDGFWLAILSVEN
jgi:AcrR family transcriptional regulator